jgi:L-lactate dehydrogenase complex protein LldE
MLVHQYHALFEDDPDWQRRADAIAARCVEFSAFAASHLEQVSLALTARVVYHPSCHLARGLGIDKQPRAIIDAIAGIDHRALGADDECCGFGGLFSVKHADISSRMLARKVEHISSCGAERLVSCDMGCLLHIGGALHRRGTGVQVQHLAELMAEALR